MATKSDLPPTLSNAPCLDDADRWLDCGDDPELKAGRGRAFALRQLRSLVAHRGRRDL